MGKSTGKVLTDLAGDLLGSGKVDLDTILDTAGGLLGGGLGKKSYPILSAANWNKLIARFRSNVPTNINKRWLADALDITQSTAESSVLPALKEMGIVTRDEKSTKLAEALGNDRTYRSAVAKILKAEYPEDLLAMDYASKTAQTKIQTWFKKSSGESDAKAKSMAALYLLLRKEADREDSAAAASTSSAAKKSAGVSVTLKLDFPSKSAADSFVKTLNELAQQLSGKISKL